MTGVLSPDTEAVLLLCGHLAPKEVAAPLDLREYNALEERLHEASMTPARLLEAGVLDSVSREASTVDRERVARLLERGTALALALERWFASGIWIVSRRDADYSSRVREHLGRGAPALMFGIGEIAAMGRGGLAMVGSRDVDEEAIRFAAEVAAQCAREAVPVISGGARGVDQVALTAALDAGGSAIAVLPEGLSRASVAPQYRAGLREETLVLISTYAPHAPFSIGNAMGRNRMIYALSDAALVVSSAHGSGGTWAGAEEELRRAKAHPLYVREALPVSEGNEALRGLGAIPFPPLPLQAGVRALFATKPARSPKGGQASLF